jgi:hypothetical protein
MPGAPTSTRAPDETVDQDVCLATRDLAAFCAASAWGAPFGGCPDLATLRAAIEAGTVDPLGVGIRRATTEIGRASCRERVS